MHELGNEADAKQALRLDAVSLIRSGNGQPFVACRHLHMAWSQCGDHRRLNFHSFELFRGIKPIGTDSFSFIVGSSFSFSSIFFFSFSSSFSFIRKLYL